jgi:hypothetical protein
MISNMQDVFKHLNWCSYEANRKGGMTHEQLVKLKIGNDEFREKYDAGQKAHTEEVSITSDKFFK